MNREQVMKALRDMKTVGLSLGGTGSPKKVPSKGMSGWQDKICLHKVQG